MRSVLWQSLACDASLFSKNALPNYPVNDCGYLKITAASAPEVDRFCCFRETECQIGSHRCDGLHYRIE